MANRNGMGPTNEGPMTGRGLGVCGRKDTSGDKVGLGLGMGSNLGRGIRKGLSNGGRGRGQAGFFRNNSNNNSHIE